jgi:hypothetical protein
MFVLLVLLLDLVFMACPDNLNYLGMLSISDCLPITLAWDALYHWYLLLWKLGLFKNLAIYVQFLHLVNLHIQLDFFNFYATIFITFNCLCFDYRQICIPLIDRGLNFESTNYAKKAVISGCLMGGNLVLLGDILILVVVLQGLKGMVAFILDRFLWGYVGKRCLVQIL